MHHLHIRLVEADDIIDLRHEVLRPDAPRSAAEFSTDYLSGTFHIGAFDDDLLVGCASAHLSHLQNLDGIGYQLRGMAVLTPYRSQGVGARILYEMEQEAKNQGAHYFWCDGRVAAADFYRRHGWVEQGDVYDVVGIPHLLFVKQLSELPS